MIDLVTNIIGVRALLIISAALLLICLGLGVTVEIQSARLDAAKAENKTQTVQLQAMGNQVAVQNAAVDQLLANAAKQWDRLKAAEAAAGKIEVITKERIEYIERAAIPATCPEAVTWGAAHATEIGKRWEQGGQP